MSRRKHPAPASDRHEAVCDSTRDCNRNPEHCQRLGCPVYLLATLNADQRRRKLFADLLALDPTLTTAAMLWATGGGQ